MCAQAFSSSIFRSAPFHDGFYIARLLHKAIMQGTILLFHECRTGSVDVS